MVVDGVGDHRRSSRPTGSPRDFWPTAADPSVRLTDRNAEVVAGCRGGGEPRLTGNRCPRGMRAMRRPARNRRGGSTSRRPVAVRISLVGSATSALGGIEVRAGLRMNDSCGQRLSTHVRGSSKCSGPAELGEVAVFRRRVGLRAARSSLAEPPQRVPPGREPERRKQRPDRDRQDTQPGNSFLRALTEFTRCDRVLTRRH